MGHLAFGFRHFVRILTLFSSLLVFVSATSGWRNAGDTYTYGTTMAQPFTTKTAVATEPLVEVLTENLDEIIDAKGIPMRLVPGGVFTMGSNNGLDDERPIHQVYLDAYYIDKYEVTNAFYEACVKANVCSPPHDFGALTHSNYYGNPEFDTYAVINVDWYQAKTYCEWRNGRLPTEAEWEKAARGTDERTYPWGEGIDCTRANYLGENCGYEITEVGRYEKGVSPYGVYDMAGNVWEWVADWYSETFYLISPFENPLGPGDGQYRVLRGGAMNTSEFAVRASHRMAEEPDNWEITIGPKGFRCARSP